MKWLPVSMTYSPNEKRISNGAYKNGLPPQEVSPKIVVLGNITVGVMALVLFLSPIYVMAIDPEPVKGLITISVYMLGSILLLLLFVRMPVKALFVCIAGYACVFVVFVADTLSRLGSEFRRPHCLSPMEPENYLPCVILYCCNGGTG
jgi:hypothetical protein